MRHLSVEIESQGCEYSDNLEAVLDRWKTSVVEDGSLGNSGFELNTQPANGIKFRTLIRETCEALKGADAQIDSSCGIHVHVDARDISSKDLRKVIALYQRVEPMLYALSGNRSSSSYCKPCGKYYGHWIHDPKQARLRLLSTLYLGGKKLTKKQLKAVKASQTDKYNQARYHALNVHSYFKRQTIEFRHHKGSIGPKTITQWALVCGWVVEYAATHSYSEIMSLPLDSTEALLTILPEHLREYVLKGTNNLQTGYWQSVAYNSERESVTALAEYLMEVQRAEQARNAKQGKQAFEPQLARLNKLLTERIIAICVD